MKLASVIIVENNTDLRNTLRHAFEDRGFLTWTFPRAGIAESIVDALHPDVVLFDLDMQGDETLEFISAWKKQSPGTCVIVESTSGDAERLRQAMEHGADGFLVKPFSLLPIFEILNKDLEPLAATASLLKENAA